MKWRAKLEDLVSKKLWASAIDIIEESTKISQNEVEASVFAIYILHDILIEEQCDALTCERASKLLPKVFNQSYRQFSENAEFLFFVGFILHINEWLFDVKDELKPKEERLAFIMQWKAFEIEPSNTLFEWAARFSLGESETANVLARRVLNNRSLLNWLASKGFPGEYILSILFKLYKH